MIDNMKLIDRIKPEIVDRLTVDDWELLETFFDDYDDPTDLPLWAAIYMHGIKYEEIFNLDEYVDMFYDDV
jgi:hypothetical protein